MFNPIQNPMGPLSHYSKWASPKAKKKKKKKNQKKTKKKKKKKKLTPIPWSFKKKSASQSKTGAKR
jgi:hypothetical protein